ncbi:MAG TPA: AraC family transcriptional regulator [Solirubrobacteraceae bacterium]
MPDPIPNFIHLRRAKDLIDRRYAEPLDVPTLAQEAYASQAHFARSFKRAFGETPRRYLTRRRIERAQELLRGTDRPLTAVALDVGFDTPSSFSRAFRQITGEPPSAYAKRWRAAGAPPVPACFALMYARPLGLSSSGQAARREPG